MHNPERMSDLKALGDCEANVDRLPGRPGLSGGRPLLHPQLKRAPVHVVHDEVGPAVRQLIDVVNPYDVLRVGPPQDPGLLHEAPADLLLMRPVLGQDLDRNPGAESLVKREPHRPERAAADDALGPVPTDVVSQPPPCRRRPRGLPYTLALAAGNPQEKALDANRRPRPARRRCRRSRALLALLATTGLDAFMVRPSFARSAPSAGHPSAQPSVTPAVAISGCRPGRPESVRRPPGPVRESHESIALHTHYVRAREQSTEPDGAEGGTSWPMMKVSRHDASKAPSR